MVKSKILLSIFNSNYISYIFNHTNAVLLAFLITANCAFVLITNIMANATVMNLVSKPGDGMCELFYFV